MRHKSLVFLAGALGLLLLVLGTSLLVARVYFPSYRSEVSKGRYGRPASEGIDVLVEMSASGDHSGIPVLTVVEVSSPYSDTGQVYFTGVPVDNEELTTIGVYSLTQVYTSVIPAADLNLPPLVYASVVSTTEVPEILGGSSGDQEETLLAPTPRVISPEDDDQDSPDGATSATQEDSDDSTRLSTPLVIAPTPPPASASVVTRSLTLADLDEPYSGIDRRIVEPPPYRAEISMDVPKVLRYGTSSKIEVLASVVTNIEMFPSMPITRNQIYTATARIQVINFDLAGGTDEIQDAQRLAPGAPARWAWIVSPLEKRLGPQEMLVNISLYDESGREVGSELYSVETEITDPLGLPAGMIYVLTGLGALFGVPAAAWLFNEWSTRQKERRERQRQEDAGTTPQQKVSPGGKRSRTR